MCCQLSTTDRSVGIHVIEMHSAQPVTSSNNGSIYLAYIAVCEINEESGERNAAMITFNDASIMPMQLNQY